MRGRDSVSRAPDSPAAEGDDAPPAWRSAAAGLAALGVLHGAVIAAWSAARDSGESLLAVAGFVAVELVLLLPLLPVAGAQGRRLLSATSPPGARVPRLAAHLTVAVAAVVAYRGGVLSVALLAELGELSLRQVGLWWRHAGPWQLQADLLVYAGAGWLLAVRSSPASRRTGGTQARRWGDDGFSADGGEAPPAGRRARPRSGTPRLTVRSGGSVHVVPVEQIRWIEGAGTYVRVHAAERSYLLRDTLAALEERLEPLGFVRVHRSAILNLDHLESLEPEPRGRWTARLADGTSVRVASSRTDRLEAALGDSLDR